jgi:ribosomal protein L11 methylase PrmA
MSQPNSGALPSSFRDPSGFVFERDGVLYRQVAERYREHYDRLMDSGLYEALAAKGALVAHDEASPDLDPTGSAYRVLKPERVPFVSYPYEWCFGQLQQAALLTLDIQREAIERGMTLKDASAYNVQFVGCEPVFIDTLSFETYREGHPWVAYRQFCQHFLAPLALMSRVDVRLSGLLRNHLDGVPLDLAAALLPWRTKLSFPLLTHVHLHARTQRTFADRPKQAREMKVGKLALVGLVESLRKVVASLAWEPAGTEWADYYENTNYAPESMRRKEALVASFVERAGPRTVWDLGANTGAFSRIASRAGAYTIAFDVDPAAVEKNFRRGSADRDRSILPLVLDATNPSPDLGWENLERESLAARGPADAVLALALVHHLAIGNNVPLDRVARFFARLGRWLVIEFVPKADSQVERLLASREDVFPDYDRPSFEARFGEYFEIVDQSPVEGTERTLYLMQRR